LSQHTEPTAHKPFAVLQSVFYVMVFAAGTLALLYFFANEIYSFKNVFAKKNKQVQPTPRSKKPRQKKLPEAK